MDREALLRLLAEEPGAAFEACGDAIRAGADFVVWDHTIPADELTQIYARRAKHLAKIGNPMLGGAEAIEQLEASGDRPLRTGEAKIEDPPTHFQIFLTADASRVVACIGIDQR
ncbi:hypothetical protein KZZ52_08315 [Dactylosporangium sp. AC04546]|uniref:hypothetical protein n=1 Tax=Dactylosporangium sp. AC04546 TaxID=2862460 RepID=UPI001EDE29CE|nr:hypothetical protein [Dactylosporangium sp. AC04546]WVK85380.1 hypothetical protein KZZ52_08315 [Dactylosporangium sp. AC04546]